MPIASSTIPAYESANIVGIRAVVPEAVLTEARTRAAKPGRVIVPRVGNGPYVRMTDAEVAAAAESERGLKGRRIGMSPYAWERGK